jgi:hypothetical protein
MSCPWRELSVDFRSSLRPPVHRALIGDVPPSEIKPLLLRINLVARDVELSIAFYRRLGLSVEEMGPDEWRPHHATHGFARMTAAGSVAQKAPEDAFWGSRYAIIEDLMAMP